MQEPSGCLAARAARQCCVSGSQRQCCDPDLASAPSVQTHHRVSCLRCWACGWRSAGVTLWCRSHMQSSTNQQRCNDTWNELHWLFFIHCMLNRSQAYNKSCLLFVVYVFPRKLIPLKNKQPCCDYINKQGVVPAAAFFPLVIYSCRHPINLFSCCVVFSRPRKCPPWPPCFPSPFKHKYRISRQQVTVTSWPVFSHNSRIHTLLWQNLTQTLQWFSCQNDNQLQEWRLD